MALIAMVGMRTAETGWRSHPRSRAPDRATDLVGPGL